MADGTAQRVSTGFAQTIDAAILARARRGDMVAFAEIYTVYGRPCYTLALRLLGSTSAAEDVVQDVFLKLMDAVRGFRGDAPFGAWLKRMTANAAIDQLRKAGRGSAEEGEAALDALAASETAPATAIDAWSLLQRLPAQARAIVVLHQFEGYSHKELAALFGQTESYSKSILSRALQRLQKSVRDDSTS
ncbi:MAG: sigma-70 family RNA polymerase sigma factor [Dokdonella sp.]